MKIRDWLWIFATLYGLELITGLLVTSFLSGLIGDMTAVLASLP